jgi:hypothetical protein
MKIVDDRAVVAVCEFQELEADRGFQVEGQTFVKLGDVVPVDGGTRLNAFNLATSQLVEMPAGVRVQPVGLEIVVKR